MKDEKLIQVLKRIGVDGKELQLIEKNLYFKQKVAVRVDGELSDRMEIKQGVRQGCVLSPNLFSLYVEMIMREGKGLEHLKVAGQNISNIMYADDTVLIADAEVKLKILLERVNWASEEKGLNLSLKKDGMYGNYKRERTKM